MPRYYTATHPLLKDGDPARGAWKPWESSKAAPKDGPAKRNQPGRVGVSGTTPTSRA